MTLTSGMTNLGLELLAKSQTGKKIYFTRMKIGNGILSEDRNFAELTDLISVVDSLNIKASEIIEIEDEENCVGLKVSSTAIQKDHDYYFREIGLFAIDPDTEDEILYAYINKGDNPTYIPATTNSVAIQELATMIVAIGNEDNIIVNCDAELKVIEQIEGNGGYSLFDTVIKDHVLSFEESEGFALQGTFVYKDGIAGERWGYPDFIAQCIKEKQEAEPQRMTLGNSTIMCYVHSNGHIYYDISDKEAVDAFFNTMGAAWFYGVDEENERVFLPRNIYFFKSATSNPGQYNAPQLPSLAHSHILTIGSGGSHSHSVTIGYGGSHTHTRGSMNITGTGILSSTRLSKLVAAGTINASGKYYSNFYSGAFYMSNTGLKFPDVGDSYQGSNGGLVSFDASRSWTGSTSSSGSHNHSATVNSNGSHTHESTLSSTNAAGNYSGTTVQPPSVNGLLYIVVGNVRQKSAVVINTELQNAIAMIQARQALAQTYINETKTDAIDDINSVKDSALSDIETAGNEQITLINSDLNSASNYVLEAQRQAQIAEEFANLAVAGQMQTDWNQEDTNAIDYIKNKPNCDWDNITYKENEQILKNKSISASDNTITNLPFNSLAEGVVLTNINRNNATNDTLATSSAILNAINDLPVASKTITDNLSNLDNLSDEKLPTALAVYNAIKNSSNAGGLNISGDNGIEIDTVLNTDVNVTSSNFNLTITSSYTGTQQNTGTKTYNFIYKEYDNNGVNDYGWFDENNEIVNLIDYYLSVVGEPSVDDTISLQYVTTSSSVISADVADVALTGSYNDLVQKPIWGNGLTPTINLITTANAEISNEELTITCTYSGTQSSEGTVSYYFNYDSENWLDENENIVNLADYDLVVTGTPNEGDIISLTYTTVSQLSVSTNISIPTKLSEFNDDLGNNPTHTHNQYLTSHQDISGKANDNAVVHLSGTETITGSKTFSGSVSLGSSATATTQAITDNDTSIATTAFARTLSTHQPITTLSSGTITLTSGVSLYKIALTAATTFTFNLSGTSASSSVAYTFELCIVMSTVYSLTFPSSVTWQNGEAPDMSSTGTYFLAFRTLDGGTTWLGNLQGKW